MISMTLSSVILYTDLVLLVGAMLGAWLVGEGRR